MFKAVVQGLPDEAHFRLRFVARTMRWRWSWPRQEVMPESLKGFWDFCCHFSTGCPHRVKMSKREISSRSLGHSSAKQHRPGGAEATLHLCPGASVSSTCGRQIERGAHLKTAWKTPDNHTFIGNCNYGCIWMFATKASHWLWNGWMVNNLPAPDTLSPEATLLEPQPVGPSWLLSTA